MDSSEIAFQIILHAGSARSSAMEALAFAKNGEFSEAADSVNNAKKELNDAHHLQTKLIQNEAAGEKTEISILLIHAQDHLMNAITVKDLASEFVTLYEKISTLSGAQRIESK